MKIPKKIDKLIEKRQKLAEELNAADLVLCEWLENKGINTAMLQDSVATGCMMYCEPGTAANNVRKAIEEF